MYCDTMKFVERETSQILSTYRIWYSYSTVYFVDNTKLAYSSETVATLLKPYTLILVS